MSALHNCAIKRSTPSSSLFNPLFLPPPPSSLLPPPSSRWPPEGRGGHGRRIGIYLNLQPQNLRVMHDRLIRESMNHVVLPLAFRAADCCALRRGHVPDITLVLQRVHRFEPGCFF